MPISFKNVGSILSKLYFDRVDVYRYVDSENEDGTITTRLTETKVIDNAPCRASFRYQNRDKPLRDTEEGYPIAMEAKIFCNIDVDIKKGDKLFIRRFDDLGTTQIGTYEGLAGVPFLYHSHKEVPIGQEGMS